MQCWKCINADHSFIYSICWQRQVQYVSCLVSTGNFFIDKNFKTVEYGGLKHVVPFGTIPLQGTSAPKFLCYPVLHTVHTVQEFSNNIHRKPTYQISLFIETFAWSVEC